MLPLEDKAVRYALALICPPLAVLLCGKPIQFLLNCVLTLCLIVPGIVHALFVVNSHLSVKRTNRIVKAIRTSAPKA